jgi:hypothetical protein
MVVIHKAGNFYCAFKVLNVAIDAMIDASASTRTLPILISRLATLLCGRRTFDRHGLRLLNEHPVHRAATLARALLCLSIRARK